MPEDKLYDKALAVVDKIKSKHPVPKDVPDSVWYYVNTFNVTGFNWISWKPASEFLTSRSASCSADVAAGYIARHAICDLAFSYLSVHIRSSSRLNRLYNIMDDFYRLQDIYQRLTAHESIDLLSALHEDYLVSEVERKMKVMESEAAADLRKSVSDRVFDVLSGAALMLRSFLDREYATVGAFTGVLAITLSPYSEDVLDIVKTISDLCYHDE